METDFYLARRARSWIAFTAARCAACSCSTSAGCALAGSRNRLEPAAPLRAERASSSTRPTTSPPPKHNTRPGQRPKSPATRRASITTSPPPSNRGRITWRLPPSPTTRGNELYRSSVRVLHRVRRPLLPASIRSRRPARQRPIRPGHLPRLRLVSRPTSARSFPSAVTRRSTLDTATSPPASACRTSCSPTTPSAARSSAAASHLPPRPSSRPAVASLRQPSGSPCTLYDPLRTCTTDTGLPARARSLRPDRLRRLARRPHA